MPIWDHIQCINISYIIIIDTSITAFLSTAQSQSSFPSFSAPRNLSMSSQHFLTGSFGRLPFHRKSGGYFVQSDNPYTDGSPNSGSGGDSDSSQESWSHITHTSGSKHSYSFTKSVDISQGRSTKANSLLQTVLSIGKRKKLSTVPISQNELVERLKKMISFAVDSAVYSGNHWNISCFFGRYLNFYVLDLQN